MEQAIKKATNNFTNFFICFFFMIIINVIDGIQPTAMFVIGQYSIFQPEPFD